MSLDNFYFLERLSPSNRRLALSYMRNDSLHIALIDLQELSVTKIASRKGTFPELNIGMAWNKNDSVLYYNFYKWKESRNTLTPQNLASYSVQISDLSSKSLKIDNGAVIETCLPNDLLVVSSGRTYYLVNLRSLKTVHTLKNVNKPVFSPDGSQYFYLQDTEVIDYEGRSKKIPELLIADISGKNLRKAVTYKFDPRNPQWLSDSKTISLDIRSQDWRDIRHMALLDVSTSRVRFATEEDYMGMPSITEPHYSPSGRYVVFDRELQRGDYSSGLSWYYLHKVFRDTYQSSDLVISEGGTNNLYDPMNITPIGKSHRWFTDDNFVFYASGWTKIFNVPSRSLRTFQKSMVILYVAGSL
jgi:Tol biopolymer transport system component